MLSPHHLQFLLLAYNSQNYGKGKSLKFVAYDYRNEKCRKDTSKLKQIRPCFAGIEVPKLHNKTKLDIAYYHM